MNSADTGFRNNENVAPISDGMLTIMPIVAANAIDEAEGGCLMSTPEKRMARTRAWAHSCVIYLSFTLTPAR